MLSQRALNIEKLVKQSMITKKMNQIHDFLAIQCSIHFTADHNVYLCINSNFFPHYLICTWVIGYFFVHTMFRYLFNELWPSCIHTVLPTRCPQMISNAQQKMKNMLLAQLSLVSCRLTRHSYSKTLVADLMRLQVYLTV